MAFKIKKPAAAPKKAANAKIVKRTPKQVLTEGYSYYEGVNIDNAPVLEQLVKFSISSYKKLKMLMLSSIESGKPSEQTKMLSYFRGFCQVKDHKALDEELARLEKLYGEYRNEGDPEPVIACFKKTDEYIKTLQK
ncbi:coil containing protein [Vibrio phage 1.215.B._10N.222.54.F7]|nr:coil containing protein [Vibrio phage 1.215.A._10N.222.54.F7]AUR96028.1 coil containing protein [Vibrio phage 1.215.B._10N.222.54.F7]